MVRLDRDKKDSKENEHHAKDDDTAKNKTVENELEKFSSYVLKILFKENIPPLPDNYQIYFEKLLENKPLPFKKRIGDLLKIGTINDDMQRAKMEIEVKEGFNQVKSIMKVVSTVYKNTNIMKTIAKKRGAELEVSVGQLSTASITSALSGDLEKLSTLMGRQMATIKTHYDRTGIILKEIESKAVFDARFGIYNRRYFLKAIEIERSSISQLNHQSTLVLTRIKDTVLGKIDSSRDRMILTTNIARLLLKTSRRSDVLAHYGDGIFGMLMKHTDIENAKLACERISELIYSTSFFIGDGEVETDMELAIAPIAPKHTAEVAIAAALDALSKTGKSLEPYIVCEFKEKIIEEDEGELKEQEEIEEGEPKEQNDS